MPVNFQRHHGGGFSKRCSEVGFFDQHNVTSVIRALIRPSATFSHPSDGRRRLMIIAFARGLLAMGEGARQAG